MWWWFKISGNHCLVLEQREGFDLKRVRFILTTSKLCLGDNTRCFLSINSHSRYTVCTTSKCNATFAVVFSNVFLFDLRCAGKKSMRHEDKEDKKGKVRRLFSPRFGSWRSCFCFSRVFPLCLFLNVKTFFPFFSHSLLFPFLSGEWRGRKK